MAINKKAVIALIVLVAVLGALEARPRLVVIGGLIEANSTNPLSGSPIGLSGLTGLIRDRGHSVAFIGSREDLVLFLANASDITYMYAAPEAADPSLLDDLEEAMDFARRIGARFNVVVIDENGETAGEVVSFLAPRYCPLGSKISLIGPLDNEAAVAAFTVSGDRLLLATGYTGYLSLSPASSAFILPSYPVRLSGPQGSYIEVFGYVLANSTLGGEWIPLAAKCYKPGTGYMVVIADSTLFVNAVLGSEYYASLAGRLLEYVLPSDPSGSLVVFDLSLYLGEEYRALAEVHPSTVVILGSRLYYEAERLGIGLLSSSASLSPLLLALTLATATLILSIVAGESKARKKKRGEKEPYLVSCAEVEDALRTYGYSIAALWRNPEAARALGGEDHSELSRAAKRSQVLCRAGEYLQALNRLPPLRPIARLVDRLAGREALKLAILAGITGEILAKRDKGSSA